MAKKSSTLDVPVGANKRYLVMCDGQPFAGFDEPSKAKTYVAMQMNKKNGDGKEAFAAQKTWTIRDTKKG